MFTQKYLGRLPAGLLRLCGSLTPTCSSLPSKGPDREFRTCYNGGNLPAMGQQFPLMANKWNNMINDNRWPIKCTGTLTTAYNTITDLHWTLRILKMINVKKTQFCVLWRWAVPERCKLPLCHCTRFQTSWCLPLHFLWFPPSSSGEKKTHHWSVSHLIKCNMI